MHQIRFRLELRPDRLAGFKGAYFYFQQPLYMCFVDFKKAFDSISHDKLWMTMMDMGYPLHLIDLLAKLCRKQLAKVKVAGTHCQNGFVLRNGSDKVVSSLRTCSTS